MTIEKPFRETTPIKFDQNFEEIEDGFYKNFQEIQPYLKFDAKNLVTNEKKQIRFREVGDFKKQREMEEFAHKKFIHI